jgi:predicted transcriptional regulator
MKPQQLIKQYGSQYAVAKAFGVTRAAVQQWVKAGKVPEARRWQYEAGKVARPK